MPAPGETHSVPNVLSLSEWPALPSRPSRKVCSSQPLFLTITSPRDLSNELSGTHSSENLPRASQKPWLQFLEVPLEIWAEVAALSGRQSIARLSAVSHAFYSIFSTILYGDMTVTARALTWQQAQLLIRTLCEHSHSPTQSIRTLCLPGMGYYRAIDMSQCLGALRGLLDTAPLKAAKFSKEIRVVRGAALRTLKWDSEMGANELSCLLLTPGYFPNLKELSVACGVDSLAQEKEPTQFDFIRVRDLEKLECLLTFSFYEGYEQCQSLWRTLGRKLRVLPLSSPLLHTFVLRLQLYLGRDPPPGTVDAYLNAAIDALRLPALTSFEFSLDAWEFPLCDHTTVDFSPVLRASPLLTNLTLNVDGICVPSDADAAYLPRLRTFTGSVNNCAAVSAHARELRNVTILIPLYYDRPQSPPFPFTPSLFRRNAGPAVTMLDARAVAPGGYIVRYPALLCPAAFAYLAAAFPNLTHLNASLGKPMSHYRACFAALPMLQYLGVRLHERVRLADYGCTPAALFPAEKYAAQIDSALHSLVQLSDVHILLWGERSEVELAGCESCDEGSSALPDFLIKYRFRRTLGEREFKLIEMTASSSEWLEMEMGRYGTDLNVEAVEALNQVRKTFAGW